MAVQPEHTGILHRVIISDISRPAARCTFACTTESLLCSAGEIIVLQAAGEVDLSTLPILRTALDDALNQHPAHLVIDLARMTFCSARGLTLLSQTGCTAARSATGYAVSGIAPQIDYIWTLGWDGDLPVRYRSTAAAVTAIRAAELR